MKLKTVKDLKEWRNKKVFLRVDFNVPMSGGKIIDDTRLNASLATIEYLRDEKAVIVLVAHLGRPKGFDKSLSLKPIFNYLKKKLDLPISFFSFSGDEKKYLEKIQRAISKGNGGDIFMLDNVRFLAGEEENSAALAKKLSDMADIYVLDGFSVAHRESATVTGMAHYLPSYAGFLLESEVNGLSQALSGKEPIILIAGGLKTETKLPLIDRFLSIADHILVGGEVFNTYLFALGKNIGISKYHADLSSKVKKIFSSKKIIKPIDVVVGEKNGKGARVVKVKDLNLSGKEAVFDIGPETIRMYADYTRKANTLVWNGALGFFEQPPYDAGTLSIARLLASRSRGKAYGVAGGGETILALNRVKMIEHVDFVSTGGGAMLEFLSFGDLPGLKALRERE